MSEYQYYEFLALDRSPTDKQRADLGWLLSVQSDDVDDEDTEPPVPAGLKELSAPLPRAAPTAPAQAQPPRALRQGRPAPTRVKCATGQG